jgi:predicted amidohydrolase YtcJ
MHRKKIRIGYAKLCKSISDAEKLPDYRPMTEFRNNYHGSMKLISDGSNQGLTGYQSEHYCCEPKDNKGAFNFPPFSHPDEMTADCDFTKIIQNIIDKGWPLMIHANGDKAINLTLDAYQIALKGNSGIPKRHRIEHCSIVNQDTLKRIQSLGISPSFLIGHVGFWGYVFKKAIFEEKANHLDVCQSALKMDMCISLHSDCFVTPLGPLRMMEQAITRIMEEDEQPEVLNESEKITPEQALKIITYNAAWQCHADKWVGSLEEGKMADYVILAEDPIARGHNDPVGMRDISMLETWVEGRCVYKKGEQ